MIIGLAVITYNRPMFLKRCLESLEATDWGGATERIVIIDEPCDTVEATEKYLFLFEDFAVSRYFGPNGGCAVAKNRAIKELLSRGCDHIFIMEDDQLMLSNNTCQEYINYAKEKGLQHMNFAHHGNQKKLKFYLELNGTHCYPDCVGAFSYYTKECIETVGYLDEHFKNAWEHVEHTMRVAHHGLTLPFWFFADHPNSSELLCEQEGSLEQSVIRPLPGWRRGMEEGIEYWVKKHGKFILPRPDLNKLAEDPRTKLKIWSKEEKIKK